MSMQAVAPHAGARIETSERFIFLPSFASLPTRERELKRLVLLVFLHPFKSLPTRERELKRVGRRRAFV